MHEIRNCYMVSNYNELKFGGENCTNKLYLMSSFSSNKKIVKSSKFEGIVTLEIFSPFPPIYIIAFRIAKIASIYNLYWSSFRTDLVIYFFPHFSSVEEIEEEWLINRSESILFYQFKIQFFYYYNYILGFNK